MSEIVQIKGEIQLQPRKWYALFKKGWHKHTDIFNKPYWIRYNWAQCENIARKPLSEMDKLIEDEFEKYNTNKNYNNEIINLFCAENIHTSEQLQDLDINKLPFECVFWLINNNYDLT